MSMSGMQMPISDRSVSSCKVAVLMSTYCKDDVSLLALAVESILQQDYPGLHLFLAVDGPHSPEGEDYLTKLDTERITIVRNRDCRGLAVSLNTLIHKTIDLGFDYFARMDSDDICCPDRIRKQLDFLAQHPTVHVVGCSCYEIDGRGARIGILKKPKDNATLRSQLPLTSPFIHSSVVLRRIVFVNHRYPTDQFISEDFALWFRLQEEGYIFANVQEPLIEYRRDSRFRLRRSRWKRVVCEAKIRWRCLQLPGLFTFKNCVGVLGRIGAQCALRLAPDGLVTSMLRFQRRLAGAQ